MQRRVNIMLVISLCVLIVLIPVTYVQFNQQPPPVAEDLFRPDDLSQIDHIRLDSIDLSYNGLSWRVNNEHDADANMITVLFATIAQAVPQREVAVSMRDSVASRIRDEGVYVEMFDDEERLLSFYAGGNPQRTIASFVGENGIPYIMHIPGYRVYVSGIFEQPLREWRNKRVFDMNWRNFSGMTVEFPGEIAENFDVTMSPGAFFSIERAAEVDTSRLNTFLDDVSLLAVVNYAQDGDGVTDSLRVATGMLEILVFDVAGNEYSLKVFGGTDGSDEVLSLINGEQAAFISREDLDRVYKKRSFFLGDEGVEGH